eukprot:TRINITY_DN2455_c0_g2_i2.p1 TRINITY_DN2455_c0_g2~~TRINITY_DN2455_c0_g2_i2.p1  ORF type:complete len:186 (+),score=21.49 TRINITY_DN2455_c0_g2_i2:1164-1721(+)
MPGHFAGLRRMGFFPYTKPSKFQFKRWKIVKGDWVQVVSGKDKGKQGKVKKVYRKRNRVKVEGCGLVRKHIKKSSTNKGQIISMESPIHVSNVSLIDPVTKKPTRVSFGFQDDGTKVRISKKSGSVIKKPKHRPRKAGPVGDGDTPAEVVVERTYVPPAWDFGSLLDALPKPDKAAKARGITTRV